MKKAGHVLLFAVVASVTPLSVLASGHKPIEERQLLGGAPTTSSTAAPATTNGAGATTTDGRTTTTNTSQAPTTTPTSSATVATSASPSSAISSTTSHASSSAASPSQSEAVVSSAVPTTATNSEGQIITSFVEETFTPSSAAPSQTGSSNSSDNGGLSTGSIIGLSVAGGIAAIGIVLFFVWKFTRKRFTDFDDGEAIKWPELNAHNNDVHALPTNATGRAGFGPENDSDFNLTRAPSPGGAYANSIAASSVPEMYGGVGDPYAVPPLPHLNPNQPYHDEPGAYVQPVGYYDPYRGPVPNAFTDTFSDAHGSEAIPMTQIARSRSPAPQMAYDMQGRGSPAPQAALGYAGIDERSGMSNPAALGAGIDPTSPHLGHP